MKLVLLSGGSGKRLWPLSNDARSKQFLKVMPGGEDGKRLSMLQRVWKQVAEAGLQPDAYVCASEHQVESIVHHVGMVNVIVEPMRRDTFPAIALASLYFDQLLEDSTTDETIVVAPVDHYVGPDYFEAVRQLPEVLAASSADVALLGVQPTWPSSQFGYIQVQPQVALRKDAAVSGSGVREVQRFVEKPDEDRATELIGDGALWNCGVFCFRLSFIREFLEQRGYPTNYADFLSEFGSLPKLSFDKEVLERTARIVVQPFSGMWKDLGTWTALVDELDTDTIGRAAQSDCKGTFVLNSLDIPVIIKGIQDAIVVASPDGVLVAHRDAASDIKDEVNEHSIAPMCEEREWGSVHVMERTLSDCGEETVVNSVRVYAGAGMSVHRHTDREETWIVTEGHGFLQLGDRVQTISRGDVVRIAQHVWHSLSAQTELRMIEIQRGSRVVAEDIERLAGIASGPAGVDAVVSRP